MWGGVCPPELCPDWLSSWRFWGWYLDEEARNNNGHQDGYSGDIQTVSGYHKVRDYPRFGSKKFTDWLDERVENLDKNHCEYIEITGSQLIKLKETNGLKGKKGYRAFLFYGMGAS